MKLFIFLNLLVFNFFNCEEFDRLKIQPRSGSNLVDAVHSIMRQIFSREIAVSNLVLPEASENFLTRDFKDELLVKSLTYGRVVYRQDTAKNLKPLNARLKRCNVFIIESYREFFEIYLKVTPDVFRFNGYYVVTLVNGFISEVEEIFKLMWKIQIFNVIVIFEVKNESVLVQTFKPFHDKNCADTSPVLVNEFTNGKFVSNVDNLFAEKMKNMHKCHVRLAVANDMPPFVHLNLLKNGSSTLAGHSINLINTLSERLNFRINFTFIGAEGFIFENGTSEGPLKALLDDEADLSITNWWLKTNRLRFFESSTSYSSDSINFIIPPGKVLTPFDKLIFPFQISVWILIILCFLIALLVITVTKRQPKAVRNFVFGDGVKNHYLNLLGSFLGGTQTALPRRNFARFLLMSFLLYSLVIRTLYQGSYYKFSQSNKHYKRVESVEEMVEQGFTFYVYQGLEDVFKQADAIKNRSGSQLKRSFANVALTEWSWFPWLKKTIC